MVVRLWHLAAITALLTVPAMASRSHRAPTSGHGKGAHHGSHRLAVSHVSHIIQGQRQIDSSRTREIQSALIQRNYLAGEATGEWTPETEAAMQKFQSDNGWQTKLMPDSRALIKLGLGPDSLSGSQGASTFSASAPAAAEAGTLASAHSISN